MMIFVKCYCWNRLLTTMLSLLLLLHYFVENKQTNNGLAFGEIAFWQNFCKNGIIIILMCVAARFLCFFSTYLR